MIKENVGPYVGPFRAELEAGKQYSWCACGKSSKEPFCDGSHKLLDSGVKSFKFEVQEKAIKMLCGCKQTKNPPYCDGNHLLHKAQGI